MPLQLLEVRLEGRFELLHRLCQLLVHGLPGVFIPVSAGGVRLLNPACPSSFLGVPLQRQAEGAFDFVLLAGKGLENALS